MLPVIENLLILQDRDRKIMRIEAELANLAPERVALEQRAQKAQTQAEAGKQKAKQLESDRKKLELDVEAKKKLIEKYSLQQFQTKKNEEYRALAHEIDMCKEAIFKIEDQQLELMEKAEVAAKEVAVAAKASADLAKQAEMQIKEMNDREVSLNKIVGEVLAPLPPPPSPFSHYPRAVRPIAFLFSLRGRSTKQLDELRADHEKLAEAVEEGARAKYDR